MLPVQTFPHSDIHEFKHMPLQSFLQPPQSLLRVHKTLITHETYIKTFMDRVWTAFLWSFSREPSASQQQNKRKRKVEENILNASGDWSALDTERTAECDCTAFLQATEKEQTLHSVEHDTKLDSVISGLSMGQ